MVGRRMIITRYLVLEFIVTILKISAQEADCMIL